MWPNPLETADMVTFTEEILNGKLHFCKVRSTERYFEILFQSETYSERCWLFPQKSFILDVWLISEYACQYWDTNLKLTFELKQKHFLWFLHFVQTFFFAEIENSYIISHYKLCFYRNRNKINAFYEPGFSDWEYR